MGINTPRSTESQDKKFDDKKKKESEVEKLRAETQKKVIKTMG
jgi:hypothetical protein